VTTARASASSGFTTPEGTWRPIVRGFFASMSRSAQRLKAMALVRAHTMHASIATTRSGVSGT